MFTFKNITILLLIGAAASACGTSAEKNEGSKASATIDPVMRRVVVEEVLRDPFATQKFPTAQLVAVVRSTDGQAMGSVISAGETQLFSAPILSDWRRHEYLLVDSNSRCHVKFRLELFDTLEMRSAKITDCHNNLLAIWSESNIKSNNKLLVALDSADQLDSILQPQLVEKRPGEVIGMKMGKESLRGQVSIIARQRFFDISRERIEQGRQDGKVGFNQPDQWALSYPAESETPDGVWIVLPVIRTLLDRHLISVGQ